MNMQNWEKKFDKKYGNYELFNDVGTDSWKFKDDILGKNIKNFISVLLSQKEAERWSSPCKGCKGGHPSFWKTIVESPQWELWEKEQYKQFALETRDKCYDIDECRECGWISQSHFQDFVRFIVDLANNK